MATIKQIAKKAGVSPTTVSNVINGRTEKVSSATLDTVRSVLDAENYTPNLAAQLLAHKKSHIIGVIVYNAPRVGETMFEDPFTSIILGAFEEEIRREGYYLMVHVTHSAQEVIKLSKTWKLDGLLILWLSDDATETLLESSETPTVFLDCYYTGSNENFYNVGLDDFKGGYVATKHFIDKGHKRIAVITDDEEVVGGYKFRFEGYKKAFEDSQLPISESSLITISRNKEKRFEVYKKLTAKDSAYTALFFLADYYAAEAISFFQENNVKVPDDVSVIGFDDNIYSRMIHPQITTVHQDTFDRAKTAVRLLLKIINGEHIFDKNIKMDVKLIERDTVKLIPNS